jgi:alpha-N-acetylglucosaminidase
MVIDMSTDGTGEFTKWGDSSFFGAPFIWTALHNFGGTDGMKGDLGHLNAIPYGGANTTAIGMGHTPEGINQNPVYYDFLTSAVFRPAPVPDITAHVVLRSHRRYGLTTPNADVTTAWALLVNSTYAQDLSVQDATGVPHFPGSSSQFQPDRATPTPRLCDTWQAWGALLAAAPAVAPGLPTYRYDLVDVSRELLAQLSTPVSQNFSDAIHAAAPLDAARISATGTAYISLLNDIDALVGTEYGFLLGPWIQSARAWGANASDCNGTIVGDLACPDFYEWNARCQLTTWNPTPQGAASIPGGPIDYASKHWSGLIKDYYAARAAGIMQQALADAAAGRALNTTAVAAFEAAHAYSWQTATNPYPVTPVGDAVALSTAMRAKYAPFYAAC